MVRSLCFFLIVSAIFAILSCSDDSRFTDEPPPAVIWVVPSSDLDQNERGIDALPEGTSIQLNWYRSTNDLVVGYELYRSTERSGSYQIIANKQVLKNDDTLYVDVVDPSMVNRRLYYYMTAVNDIGTRSEPSDTISYRLIEKATNLLPQGSIAERRPVFSWTDLNQINNYIIRVLKSESGNYIWICHTFGVYGPTVQQIEYNIDGSALLDSLNSGEEYIWRVDIVGPENNSGSESQWAVFQIQ